MIDIFDRNGRMR
jgi:hypothetical protein